MKILKYRFPHLSLTSRRSSENGTQPPPPSLKKKALLIGIQNIRREAVETTRENVEKTAGEDVDDGLKQEKKKKQKDRDKESAPKAAELNGPHHDIMQMKEILIGAL